MLEVLGKIERRKAFTTTAKYRTWFNQLSRFAMVEVNLPENPAADLDIVVVLLLTEVRTGELRLRGVRSSRHEASYGPLGRRGS